MKSILGIDMNKLREFIKHRKWHVAVAGVLIIALIATLTLTTIVARSRDDLEDDSIDSAVRPGGNQGDEGNQSQENNSQNQNNSQGESVNSQGDQGSGNDDNQSDGDNQGNRPTVTPNRTPSPTPNCTLTPTTTPTTNENGELRFRVLGSTGTCMNSKRVIHLVRSRNEMLNIYRNCNFSQERSEPDERYNNAYFANNSIIMFSFLAPCNVDKVILRGNRLFIYKTITDAAPPIDAHMYMLIEVNNADLRDVQSLALYIKQHIEGGLGAPTIDNEYRLYLETKIQ